MSSLSSLLLLLSSSLLPLLTCALHDSGFTWSATPAWIPSSYTDYGVLMGPGSHMYNAQIYVLWQGNGSTDIMYATYDWDDTRVWTSPLAVDGAASYGGGAVTEYYGSPVAAWSDAVTSTLTFSIQDTDSGTWGSQMTTDYSAHQSSPNLFTPITAEMFVFYRAPDSPAFGNCSYDGYSTWGDTISPVYSHCHGSSAITNKDNKYYIFFTGSDSYGNPDGFLHYMWQDGTTLEWSGDISTSYAVDTDSSISAVPWGNNTDTFIFVFYKYQNYLYYVSFNYNAGGYFLPTSGSGFALGLYSDSGPSAVVYYDPFYDTQVVTVFFTLYKATTNDFRVYYAIGMPDSWP